MKNDIRAIESCFTLLLFLVSTGMQIGQSKKKQDGVFQVPNDEIITIFFRGIPRTLKI